MDEVGTDGRLHHVVPMHTVMRVFLVIAGAVVMGLTLHELYRGVWPLNITTPFFLAIVLGAFSVGIPMVLAGFTAPSAHWIVGPGRIEIELSTPFRKRSVAIRPGQVASFELREIETDGGSSTWAVELRAVDGKRYQTRDFGSKATAGAFRDRIVSVFEG
jgi:hypothetical protein